MPETPSPLDHRKGRSLRAAFLIGDGRSHKILLGLDYTCARSHLIDMKGCAKMTKNTSSATLSRNPKSGHFVVTRSTGTTTTHVVKQSAASVLSQSKEKHKEALKRLADR